MRSCNFPDLPSVERVRSSQDKVRKSAAWSWGYVSAIDSNGRTIWIADAHRDGKRFIVRADEKLTAFMELESTICAAAADIQTQRK